VLTLPLSIRWSAERATFALLSAILFLQFLSAGLANPLLALQIRALGADYWQIATVLTTYQVAAMAAQYYWGRRSDRLGRRKPLILLGLAGLTLAYLGLGLITHFTAAYLIRAFEAVCFAAYNTASLALIGDLLEQRAARGRLMGLYRTFGSLAFALAALFGGSLADQFSLRLPFLLSAGFFALAFLLALAIRERPFTPRPATPAPGVAAPLSLRPALPFLLVAFTWYLAMTAVVPLWPVYMQDLGFWKTDITRLWALAAFGEALLMPLTGHLSDHLGRRVVLATGLLSCGVVFALYVILPTLPWLLGIQALRAFAFAAFIPIAMIYATEMTGQAGRGRAAGLYNTANGLGGIAGSALGGTLAQVLGVTTMIDLAAAVLIGVGLLALSLLPEPASRRPR